MGQPIRIDRRTYSIWSVIYVILFAMALVIAKADQAAVITIKIIGPALWMFFLGAPRMRDFGISGWFALAPFAAGFVAGFAHGARMVSTADYGIVQTAIGLGSLAFLVILALVPGTKGPNKFGRPQGAAQDAATEDHFS